MEILFRMTFSQNLCLQTPCDFITRNPGVEEVLSSLVDIPSPNKPNQKLSHIYRYILTTLKYSYGYSIA